MKKRDGSEVTPEERETIIQAFKIRLRTATTSHLQHLYSEKKIILEDSDIKPILQSHAETFKTQ